MGVCRYCGQRAGWFNDAHEACVTSARQGCEQVTALITSTLTTKLIPPPEHPDDEKWASEFVQHVWAETKPQLDRLTTEHQVPPDDLRHAIRSGWIAGAEQVATAEPMHPDRLLVLNSFYRLIGFTDLEMRTTDGFVANIFSTLLWAVMVKGNPSLVANVPRQPFNLKAGEIPLFFFGSVVWGKGISQNVVWYVVKGCCERAGLEHIAPHDLRRTCAKLCHTSGGELEQIQFLLGHASVQTTERYLGCKQNLGHPVNDLFELRTEGRPQENDDESATVKASDPVEKASGQG
jgi:hypothetical protein